MKTWNVALLLAAASLVACATPSDDGKAPVEEVRSSLARDLTPAVSPAQLDVFAQDQASFAVDLYQAVRKVSAQQNDDIFVSPHSVSTALAMTYAGARGETRTEMKKALHYSLEDESLHHAFDYLDLALESRGKGAAASDGNPFRLRIANAVWGQKGTAFESPFLDTLARSYGAGVKVVDFVNATEDARLAINGWVEDKTEDRIKELVPQGGLDAATRLVLVNAVYFNAAWAVKIEAAATTPAPFYTVDGAAPQVPTMHVASRFGYSKGDAFDAVELPYDGGETSMLLIAPAKGTFATFESSLTGGKILDVLAGLRNDKEVHVALPKLKLDAALKLAEPLKSLGMRKAFRGADFSGIVAPSQLEIKEVIHKTFLDVNEKGTEAAAATAVIVSNPTVDSRPEPIAIDIDRPFVIAIVDRQTKTLLFLGRIMKPKS